MFTKVMAKERRSNVMGFDPFEVPLAPGETKKESSKTIDLQDISARVDRVTINGLNRTKNDIIQHSVKDLFVADNFEEMIKKAHVVRQKLLTLGCFKEIAIHIDTHSGPGSTTNGYEVTYEVTELKRVSGGVTTHVANNSGILTIGGFFPNIFGRGESLRGELSYGSNKSNTTNLTYVKPFISTHNLVAAFSAFQGQNDFPTSGYNLAENGLLSELSFTSNPKWKHKLQYEANWRRLGAVTRQSSFYIRNKAGSTLKSSIHHIMNIDTRDSAILPTCGNLCQMKTEVAGLGGNVNFIKNEVNLQKNIPLFDGDFVAQAGLNLGLLNSLTDEDPIVADCFFLGGPLNFRGFDIRSIGPKAEDNFVGATMYWALGLHLYAPLPFRPASGGIGDLFRVHSFLNVGNIGKFDFSSADAFIDQQKNDLRLSAGIGIALRLGSMARAELNYCFPIRASDSDGKVEGVQFGIGVEFL